MEEVLKRLESNGIKAKKAKCSFMSKSVYYLGHKIDSQGLHTLPDKVKAILEAPQPRNVQELRSFLGFINYYCRFVPNLSAKLAPLNELLQKQTKWEWLKACSRATEEVKQCLVAAPVLMHFNPSLPITLATDASPYGVGAVISHYLF